MTFQVWGLWPCHIKFQHLRLRYSCILKKPLIKQSTLVCYINYLI
jgi:hypothetical protein